MNRLEKKFLQQLRDRQLVAEGDHVLAAVSGGPDSMALLCLLCAVAPVVPCRISAAHCNFQLRGEESLGDEGFVREQCAIRGVECFSVRFDTAAASAAGKKSLEETARELRYEWFSSLLEEHGMTKIATGHHVSDNAETMLFNLFRGTSLLGLKGIRAMHGRVIRPLLLLGKGEILDYLNEKSIPFRTDDSNFGIDYDRNFIRNRVIPLVEERFPHKLLPSLQRLSEQAGELQAFLEAYFERLTISRPGLSFRQGWLDARELKKLSVFEQKEIFKRALQESGATADAAMLQRLVSLLNSQPGRKIVVSGSLVVAWKGNRLCFLQSSP
ncbi:tRNA lysidine(34) synthetase TilS [Chlorobium sp.]|uniref:tRNA lysidine(34) synthetase TilS n=1 Tax=Chlorobium sp. TaxID=1095 RepID=UPI003C61883B|nr:tRNA lysidine(34) synthetase TilS [Chlorobiaceae bacterium]NTW93748.1 tRNA lysidine(34) synthetase TilS [Chlorobiaceae bacterium]